VSLSLLLLLLLLLGLLPGCCLLLFPARVLPEGQLLLLSCLLSLLLFLHPLPLLFLLCCCSLLLLFLQHRINWKELNVCPGRLLAFCSYLKIEPFLPATASDCPQNQSKETNDKHQLTNQQIMNNSTK
jgi:hypothetical protein